jgi:hypothetical protein
MRTLLLLVSTLALLGCDYHRSLGSNGKVKPVAPPQGAGTGTGAAGSQPTLRWNADTASDSYQVQLDDSCRIGTPCDFPSPEIDVMVTDPSYVPAAPLPVPGSGPPRQTYCWHVRGCREGACGEWSEARCFVVGADKTPNRDLNGDGYSDLVIGAPEYAKETRQGRAAVYLGGAGLPGQPAIVHKGVPYTSLGGSVAVAGDLDGDGYGDYLVARTGDSGNMNGNGPAGQVMVFFGGPVLQAQPDVVFTGVNQQYSMTNVTGCGDLDGDGYDDLAFVEINYAMDSSTQEEPWWVEVHLGGPDLATSAPLFIRGSDEDELPYQVVAAGDVDGDGYPDLLVSFVRRSSGFVDGAKLFRGRPGMDAVPDAVIGLPGLAAGAVPVAAGIGDINGDGFADLAFGLPSGGPSYPLPGAVYVFFGGRSLGADPDLVLSEETNGEGFGTALLRLGDIDQDGYGDFAVMSVGTTTMVVSPDGHSSYGVPLPGKVSLFAGGPSPAGTPFATIAAPSDRSYLASASSFDLDGDGLPEILVSQSKDRGPSTNVAIYRGSDHYVAPAKVLSGFSKDDGFGLALSQ